MKEINSVIHYNHLLLIISFVSISNCFSQQTSSFGTLQDDLASQNWNLAVNGIFLSDNISLTARQFEYANFEIGLIEVPIMLKINLTDKLSLLTGAKFDFYRTRQGLSKEVGVSLSTGLQYDVNRNAYIQGIFSYQINETNNIYDYNYGANSSFILRSGFKF